MSQKKKIPAQKEQIKFSDQWPILENGIQKLFSFLDSDQKKPYDRTEYINLYT